MKTIMILGVGGNAGMNFVKSLQMSGDCYKIIGCDIDHFNLTASDCHAKYLIKSTTNDEKCSIINEIIKKENVDFIHAQPDKEVEFLLKNAKFINTKIFPHNLNLWNLFADKFHCQSTWGDQLGIRFNCAPLSKIIEDERIFSSLISHSNRVWFRAIRGAGSKAALPVSSLDQALNWAHYWIENRSMNIDDFMLAEYLPGEEYAVQTFWINGNLVESQARQRLVYFFGNIMPSGQSSTPAVAVTVDDRDVYDTAYNAIKAIDLNPHGIYCVDLKRNFENSVVPLEINYGRFFTTSDFFSKLGVNTPANYVSYALSGNCSGKVESIKKPIFWIRGLDREPFLTNDLTT
jgi:hypothetical protein